MINFFKSLNMVAMVALLFSTTSCSNVKSEGSVSSRKSLKVLMIGNSFSICLLNHMPSVAKSMGLELDLCSMYIGGCSFERHWNNVTKASDPEFCPYKIDWNYHGVSAAEAASCASAVKRVESVNKRTGKIVSETYGNIPQLLKSDKWDVVTIQQASHFSWKLDSYRPFADNLVKTIRELAPQAKIVVQETWSYTPFDKRLANWGIDQHEMYRQLHLAYGKYAVANSFEVIPVGTAVQLFREQLPVKYGEHDLGGDVCGSAKFSCGADGKWTHKGDVFHFNSKGTYLQALVWTGKLFGVNVSECPYEPKGMDEKSIKLMKKVAQEALSGIKPSPAFGG